MDYYKVMSLRVESSDTYKKLGYSEKQKILIMNDLTKKSEKL